MAWRWRPKKEEVKVEWKKIENVEKVTLEIRDSVIKEEIMEMVNKLPWATIEKWAIRAILNSVFR